MKRAFARIMLMAFVAASLLPGGSASASGLPDATITGNITFQCTIKIFFPQKEKGLNRVPGDKNCNGTWAGWILAVGDNGQTDHYIPDADKALVGHIFKAYNIQYEEPCQTPVPNGPEDPLEGNANGQVSLFAINDASVGGPKPKPPVPLTKHTIHAAFEYERTGVTFTAIIGPNKKKTLPLHIHSDQPILKHKPKDLSKWVKHPNAAGDDGAGGGQFTPDAAPSCQVTNPEQMLTIQITGTAVIA